MILPTGAEMRITGAGGPAVVCVNGGQEAAVPGTWSATIEWLVARLAPRFPELRFVEVRYRTKSWRHLDECIDDARAGIAAAAAPAHSAARVLDGRRRVGRLRRRAVGRRRARARSVDPGPALRRAAAREAAADRARLARPRAPRRPGREPGARAARLRPGARARCRRRVHRDSRRRARGGAARRRGVRSSRCLAPARWLQLVAGEIARFGRNDGAGRGSEER